MKKERVFFIMEETGKPCAIFPEVTEGRGLVMCYAHIGQHSSAHIEYVRERPIASKLEYADLYRELTFMVGYNLQVMNKQSIARWLA
jgi:hypothetical protein